MRAEIDIIREDVHPHLNKRQLLFSLASVHQSKPYTQLLSHWAYQKNTYETRAKELTDWLLDQKSC